jgi:hypothetical protein
MSSITIMLSEKQLNKVIDAYRTIQEFLASSLSPNELYQKKFLKGMQEATDDVRSGNMKTVNSFDDFVH